jgi:alcohol dehydrogenase class IV
MAAILLPRIIRIGGGALSETALVLRQLGFSCPIIITDRFLAGNGTLNKLLETLAAQNIEARVFKDSIPDPTSDSVNAAVAFINQGTHDCVIGLGGGSSIDTAKAAAVLVVRGGQMRDLKAPHQEHKAGLPIVAIPTTAGTGSEATRFTIITDEMNNEKMLCAGLAYLPSIAIVDYELTLSKPFRLTADTGLDALTHAIEAYVSRRANPFSDSMALAAMALIWKNLELACVEPENRLAREGMMLGALQAGIAFSNASVALVHGMSRPIGAHFHIAHGLSNAMLLPTITTWSAQGAPTRYADCARAMGVVSADEADKAAVNRLLEALLEINKRLKVPSPQSYGIDKNKWFSLLPAMAEQALASGSPANNPRVPDINTIQELYRCVWT